MLSVPVQSRFKWIYVDFNEISWIYMDLEGISVIQGLGGPAATGPLWQEAVALDNTMLSPWGWQDGGWLDGWMAGWLDGGGRHHRHCNLARSTPRRVGGFFRGPMLEKVIAFLTELT